MIEKPPGCERIAKAFDAIKQWMREHDAPLLVENLAEGATKAELDEAESAFGFPLPKDLRVLWELHHGQREEMNGFVGFLDLFDSGRALGELDTVLTFVGFLREDPEIWSEAGVTREEAQSDRWVPFAGRDSDLLVVSGVTGRVFTCGKDSPPLHFVAETLAQWAEQYAARVVADDYAVEEGFGEYYLEVRDRDAERRELERARKREEDARYRRETPLFQQLQDGLSRQDAEVCRDVFDRVAGERPPDELAKAVDLLFAATGDPKLIATALQVVLRTVKLTPQQWKTVAKGGEALGNHAIRDIARTEASAAESGKPWWKRW